MKIDRRKFLSLGAGAAAGIGAGTVLSPVPWKLMDDSSIWTQNWPWTPVPKDGKVTHENTVCNLCPGRCGITVRKVGDRVVKIEGMESHPVNDGGICPLGISGPQLLYGPSRIKAPLKRADGGWKEISWKEAISLTKSKLSEIRAQGRPESLACIVGENQGTVSELFKRFLQAFGSPNFISTPTMYDTYEMVLKILQGVKAQPGFDFENTDVIMSFGSGLIDGWGSPVRMFKANSHWKARNAKVFQIEPRLSNTAAKSDKWIPINPGTESVLAMGMAYVIIKESLYDKNFAHYKSTGFDVYRQFILNKYAPENVSKITGIEASVIADLAKKFADPMKKSIAVCGRGKGSQPGSISEFMAVHALNALKGNINAKGGIFTLAGTNPIRWPKVIQDAVARKGVKKARIDGAGSGKYPDTKSLLNRLPHVINAEKESPIQVLFVSGANPCYEMSGTDDVKKVFEKIPFVVSFSTYMDETAQNADLILPNHNYLERYEDVASLKGVTKPVLSLMKPVVSPQFNTRHVGDTIISIAKALHPIMAASFPWNTYEACLKQTLGGKLGSLLKKGFYTGPGYGRSPAVSFKKFQFSPIIRYTGETGVAEGDKASFPYLLIPADSIRLASGFIGAPPFAIKTVSDTVLKGDDTVVEINPETAGKIGLSEGKTAKLSTPKGVAEVKVHLFDGIMPGIIAIPTGLGHKAQDAYLANEYLVDKGVNVNELIGPVADPASGLDIAWGIRAKLTKA